MTLTQALKFLEEIDKLKDTYRKCLVMSGKREESTAEHSFSFAMAVMALAPLSNRAIDISKAIKMALFHDLAEALTGDTFHYEKVENQSVSESEALRKVLSPIKDTALAMEIFELWNEFETGTSNEAVFLRGVDRFLPMYHNYKTKGHSWVKHGITKEQALDKNSHIEHSSLDIWKFTNEMLNECQTKGWIG